jgi:hypothetical protein
MTKSRKSLNRHARRREKVFGEGRPRPMNTNIKNRLMRLARVEMRKREPGKHWGKIKAKHLEVFEALLWGFHNAKTGLCFPSYEAIADKVPGGCARSTVALALIALEDAGLLKWVHRLKRVYERVNNMFGEGVHGQRSRVERTSNGYWFPDPPDVESSKSEDRSRTEGQESFSLVPPAPKPKPKQLDPENPLHAVLIGWGKAYSERR